MRIMLVACIAPLVFLVVYSSLQLHRLDRFEQMSILLHYKSNTPEGVNLGKKRYGHEMAWFSQAEMKLYNSNINPINPYSGYYDKYYADKWVLRVGPICLPRSDKLLYKSPFHTLAQLFALGIAGTMIAWGTLFILLRISSAVIFKGMQWSVGAKITLSMMGKAWLWAILLSALVGTATWYAGFDRIGNKRALSEGFYPTLLQLILATVVWGVGYVLMSRAMLLSAVSEYAGRDDQGKTLKCIKCLYLVSTIQSDTCPECGSLLPGRSAECPAIEPAVSMSGHRKIFRTLVVLMILISAILALLAINPTLREWVLLQAHVYDWWGDLPVP